MPDLPPSFAPANPRPRPKLGGREAAAAPEEEARPPSPVSPVSPVSVAGPVTAADPSSVGEPDETAVTTRAPRILPARLDRRTPPVRLPEPTDGPRLSAPAVSTGLAERLAERRAALRARRVRLVVIGGVAVALLGFAGWVVGFSPWLALKESEIAITGGSAQASTEEIAELVTPAVGTPLARLDTGAIADSIESIIGVKAATITRSWPHGLEVAVTARTPVAAVEQEGEFVVVDADGVELNHLEDAPEGLPVVNVPIDDRTGESVASVLTVMAALPDDVEVTEVAATGPEGIRLTLAGGATVEWGGPQESELKSAVLATLLQVEAEVYNVAEPRSPTTS